MTLQRPSQSKDAEVTTMRTTPCSAKVCETLNKQVTNELYSSNIYLSMSQWCEENGYTGSSALFRKYSDEEKEHAEKVLQFIADRDIVGTISAIPQCDKNYNNLKELFVKGLEHEKFVTSSYMNLCKISLADNDFITFMFSSEFIKEQTEEETKFINYIDKFKIFEDSPVGVFMFDHSLEQLNKN